MPNIESWAVPFIVELEDGSTHTIEIDTFALRAGDFIAARTARELQEGGLIPKGKIVEVRRAPYE